MKKRGIKIAKGGYFEYTITVRWNKERRKHMNHRCARNIMTKNEMITKLTDAISGSEYGKKVISELEANWNDDDKKYGQTIKDRLDERLGEAQGWLDKDIKDGKGDPSEVAEHIEVLKNMINAITE